MESEQFRPDFPELLAPVLAAKFENQAGFFMRWLRRLIFGIPRRDWTSERRGFPEAEPAKRRHLENILRVFVDGYHAALDDGRPAILAPKLNAIEPTFRGFAFEGAGLCLAAFDLLTPWKRNRWTQFVKGPGDSQSFILHVGYGVALAALRKRADLALKNLEHPGERWLAVDGYGFYHGFFHWKQTVELRSPPPLTGFSRSVYDQGVGRALWFGCGANVERLVKTIASFPEERRTDLWAGVGIACTFAGGVTEQEIKELCEVASPHDDQLRVGAVFAAKLRQRADTIVDYTEMALQAFCGMNVEAASRLVDSAMEGLPPDGPEPAYQILRRRVQDQVTSPQELTR